MTIVTPNAAFAPLCEAEIEAALRDPDPANPIAGEVARLIAAYTANFTAHVERLGHIPPAILHVTPRTAIEAVAMRLTTEAIRDAIAQADDPD